MSSSEVVASEIEEMEETHDGLRQRLQNGNLATRHNDSTLDKNGSSTAKEARNILKQMNLDRTKENVQQILNSFLTVVDKQTGELLDEIMQEVEKVELPKEYRMFDEISKTTKYNSKSKRNGTELPEKEFLNRNSILTDLFEVNHIKTIYHIFIAMLILLFMNTFIYEFVENGRFNLEFELLVWTFGDMFTVGIIWGSMMGSTCLVYTVFTYWAHTRIELSSELKKYWDKLWLTAFVLYLCAFIYVPSYKVIISNLPPASSSIIMTEQTRLIMKTYAFVRSNIPRVLNFIPQQESQEVNPNNDTENSPCPDFTKYLYFLFIPTLVYRDTYPRNPTIRWRVVVVNFMQVCGCIVYVYFIFVRFLMPVFRRFGREPLIVRNLVLSVFNCMLPGGLVLLVSFFCLLHSWMNAFAEMLRFADRMFYRDWWNSTSYGNYYRTWNVVVHDWLYTYVYRDAYLLWGHKRLIPTLSVFAISALVHEYILSLTFRFCYPILLFMFGGFGVALTFIPSKSTARGNIFMWLSLFMGYGIILCLYSIEWYARINCPPVMDSGLDYFFPRSWTCVPEVSSTV